MFRSIVLTALASALTLLSGGICEQSVASAEDVPANRFPNVTLRTQASSDTQVSAASAQSDEAQAGKEVDFYKDLVKDKIVIINFMYTRCKGLCIKTTQKLVQVQQILGEDLGRKVFIYSISLDPEDTPKKLKEYAEANGAKWTFLTGKKEDI